MRGRGRASPSFHRGLREPGSGLGEAAGHPLPSPPHRCFPDSAMSCIIIQSYPLECRLEKRLQGFLSYRMKPWGRGIRVWTSRSPDGSPALHGEYFWLSAREHSVSSWLLRSGYGGSRAGWKDTDGWSQGTRTASLITALEEGLAHPVPSPLPSHPNLGGRCHHDLRSPLLSWNFFLVSITP